MVPIGGEPSACAATYVPPTVPTYPQCTTQLDTGGITYARMTLYDSEANELEGGSSFMTEETCVAGCNAVNAATPNSESFHRLSKSIPLPPRAPGASEMCGVRCAVCGVRCAVCGACR
jgi:hypothetical protein